MPGGLGITVAYFRDLAGIEAWRAHAEHRAAKEHGREHWYQRYSLHIAKVEYSRGFERGAESEARVEAAAETGEPRRSRSRNRHPRRSRSRNRHPVEAAAVTGTPVEAAAVTGTPSKPQP